jgi:hypothetical protein
VKKLARLTFAMEDKLADEADEFLSPLSSETIMGVSRECINRLEGRISLDGEKDSETSFFVPFAAIWLRRSHEDKHFKIPDTCPRAPKRLNARGKASVCTDSFAVIGRGFFSVKHEM